MTEKKIRLLEDPIGLLAVVIEDNPEKINGLNIFEVKLSKDLEIIDKFGDMDKSDFYELLDDMRNEGQYHDEIYDAQFEIKDGKLILGKAVELDGHPELYRATKENMDQIVIQYSKTLDTQTVADSVRKTYDDVKIRSEFSEEAGAIAIDHDPHYNIPAQIGKDLKIDRNLMRVLDYDPSEILVHHNIDVSRIRTDSTDSVEDQLHGIDDVISTINADKLKVEERTKAQEIYDKLDKPSSEIGSKEEAHDRIRSVNILTDAMYFEKNKDTYLVRDYEDIRNNSYRLNETNDSRIKEDQFKFYDSLNKAIETDRPDVIRNGLDIINMNRSSGVRFDIASTIMDRNLKNSEQRSSLYEQAAQTKTSSGKPTMSEKPKTGIEGPMQIPTKSAER